MPALTPRPPGQPRGMVIPPPRAKRCVCAELYVSVRSTRASRRRGAARLAHDDAFCCAVGAERRSLLGPRWIQVAKGERRGCRSSRSEGTARKPRAVRGAPPRAMKRTRPHEEPKPQKPPPIPDLCAKEFGNHVTVRNDTGKRICVSLDNGQAWPWAVLAPDGVHEFTSQLPTPPRCSGAAGATRSGASEGEKHAEGGQTPTRTAACTSPE